MSGGRYGYAYLKIEELAGDIRPTSPLRKAFKEHLYKVAAACHDIEWVDSQDCAKGSEDEAIRACLGKDGPALVLAEAIAEAERVKTELDTVLEAAKTQAKALQK